MHIKLLSNLRYTHTMFWAMLLSALIVSLAATLARAAFNLKAAIIDKPDIAIYLLLPEEEIKNTMTLRESQESKDYLAETKDGPKIVRLKKEAGQWTVHSKTNLH